MNPRPRRAAASLIELLVVLFIMGIMMGMLLPALQGARNRAQATVCENNIRQLSLGIYQFLESKERLPHAKQWTIDILPWIEQRPLAEQFKYNADPNPKFPRPPIMNCPMQDEVPTRVESVGYCHYAFVVDRLITGEVERGWDLMDRPLPDDDALRDPWYVGPEYAYATRDHLFANERGPHSAGLYMTSGGLRPQ